MRQGIRALLRKFWPQLIIVSAWALIVLTNYRFATTLTGWDNLHPEYNPSYDLWRTFNAVWQEYQGLGLLGGMAHSADLVRQVIIWCIHFFWPISLIRYTMLFAMCLLGGLGAYQLFMRLFGHGQRRLVCQLAGLVTALFYLFNLGTVQNFYVAFEPFYWFFGSLPWLLDSLFALWRSPSPRAWWRLALISFASTPLAYIQTNFVVLSLVLACCGLCFLACRQGKFFTRLQVVLGSAGVIIITNLFWLLPMAYFFFTGGSQVTVLSQVNQVTTREVATQNQAYGNWRDILLLRGYWFSNQDYDTTDDAAAPIPFMQAWLDEPATEFFGIFFAVLLGTGVLYLLIYQRNFATFAIGLSFLCLCGLLMIHPFPIGILNQIFRSPFTKTIVPLSLCYSLLLGGAMLWLDRFLSVPSSIFCFCFYLVALCLYSLPTLAGHYIYHNLRLRVPPAYQEMFDLMDQLPQAERAALLPAETMYGWQHTTWRYRGIGFYWFGLKQSVLNRAFDVWSFDDEEFYQEMHYARLQDNSALFRQILTKYDVRYLIYDQSIHQRGRNDSLAQKNWLDLINENHCLQIFNKDMLQVYDCGQTAVSYISTPANYYPSNTSQFHQFFDPVLGDELNYVTSDSTVSFDYPFAYLYSREISNDRLDYGPTDQDLDITLTGQLPSDGYRSLTIPGLDLSSRQSFWLELYHSDHQYHLSLRPNFQVLLNGRSVATFQPLTFSVPELPDTDEIFFDFGSDYVRLHPQAEATVSDVISLDHFDTNQTWRYFPAASVRRQGADLNVDLQEAVELTAPPSLWDKFTADQQISIDEPIQSLQAVVHSLPIYLDSLANDNQNNCDVIFRGEVSRELLGEHGYRYQADHMGSFCDTFYNSRLDNGKHSFLVRIDAQNIAGLPLLYYFWDINHQVQSWETRLQNDQITHTFSFPLMRRTSYFDIHSANRSIAGELSANDLLQTVAYPIPTQWLTKITLSTTATSQPPVYTNPLQLIRVRKNGTSHYEADVTFKTTDQPGLIVLDQGYHPGWQARVNGRLLSPLKYDDWANGWLIDPAQCASADQSGTCTIVIDFTPQIYGWLGLFVSLLTFATAAIEYGRLVYRARRYPLVCLLSDRLAGNNPECQR
ncbi:hypothetical protein IJJ12_02850 [bacterium]|nr:hypothetical protein [bacterium]